MMPADLTPVPVSATMTPAPVATSLAATNSSVEGLPQTQILGTSLAVTGSDPTSIMRLAFMAMALSGFGGWVPEPAWEPTAGGASLSRSDGDCHGMVGHVRVVEREIG